MCICVCSAIVNVCLCVRVRVCVCSPIDNVTGFELRPSLVLFGLFFGNVVLLNSRVCFRPSAFTSRGARLRSRRAPLAVSQSQYSYLSLERLDTNCARTGRFWGCVESIYICIYIYINIYRSDLRANWAFSARGKGAKQIHLACCVNFCAILQRNHKLGIPVSLGYPLSVFH